MSTDVLLELVHEYFFGHKRLKVLGGHLVSVPLVGAITLLERVEERGVPWRAWTGALSWTLCP